MSLESKWECPECRAIMTGPPVRVKAEDDGLLSAYGVWDPTEVDYTWDGLEFPQRTQ